MSWTKNGFGAAALALAMVNGCSGSERLVGSDDASTVVLGALVSDGTASCLATPLPADSQGFASCSLLRARFDSCGDCTAPGLAPAAQQDAQRASAGLRAAGVCGTNGQPGCESLCLCEILPLDQNSPQQCQSEAAATDQSGWCYVSAGQGDGARQLLAACAANQVDEVRFMGQVVPGSGDNNVLVCNGGSHASVPVQAAVGDPCVNDDEKNPDFAGFSPKEVSIEGQASVCSSGLCIQNHFQGRASCPYGQAAGSAGCMVAGSDTPVSSAVSPQLVSRQAAVDSICSCRCAGDGPGPYCTCPDSMECTHLVDDLGLGESQLAGSYCIMKGSLYDELGDQTVCTEPTCGAAHPN